MKHRYKLVATVVLAFCASTAFAGNVIIVNPKNPNNVSAKEAKDLFIGKTKSFADGSSAFPVLTKSGKSREGFLADVVGKSDSQYKSYWASLVFTGKAQPPRELGSDTEVVNLVANNPNMIGVVDASKVDQTVKVVSQ